MARLISSIYGEFRGKVGGNVFSRNKSGMIMRQHILPTQPNTNAQVVSRTLFRVAAQQWSALSQVSQQSWNNFALAIYNPLRKVNTGQYTGNQSYVGVISAFKNAVNNVFTSDWQNRGGTPSPVKTDVLMVEPITAPLVSIGSSIKQDSNPPATIQIDGCIVTSVGAVTVGMNYNGTPAGGLDADEIEDANGNPMGFVAYISDAVKKEGGRPRNDLFIRLGTILPATFATTTLSGATGLDISFDMSSLIPNFKSWYQTDEIAKITVYALGIDGTLAKIGTEYITIT